jgi:acid phosphatase (class A)
LRRFRVAVGALIALSITAAAAIAADEAEPPPYLAAANEPDATRFLPTFPAKGSKAKTEDQFVFDSWRKKQKDPRWQQAIVDADWHTTAVLDGFSCALGVKLGPANAPKLVALLERMQSDLQVASSNSKEFFHRDRPFVGTKKATCVSRDTVGKSYSYPSGHSSLGWSFALILSELVPDHASQIMARGRAYGESRAVCGMHWESDVEAGRYVGAAVVAALHSDATFRADLDAVRAEVAAVRGGAGVSDGAACQALDASDRTRPW